MKLIKQRKYQAPRVREACLETEGIFCVASLNNVEVDPLQVVSEETIVDGESSSHTVGNYLEF